MEEKVFAYLKQRKVCKTIDVANAIEISIYQAKHYLDRLVLRGVITRSALRRGSPVLWHLNENME
ncbi:FaeA/PapI family transcriptional regulator [Edwardsiella tarda]|uniref:FaeA/PapI family transcriptional regulator n=1 Tax=Edwardsiella tarda TaxID=636 RepID=UPI000D50B33F|nr:FaeA/PapI family transcriptional regulator [Edwardsiella tarda]